MMSRERTNRQVALWTVAGISLSVAVASLVGWSSTSEARTVVLASRLPTAMTRPKPVVHPIERSVPVRLTIAAIGVNVGVGSLGLQADHQVMVPTNVQTVGWFRDGPTPGELGSAVLLGHVDSYVGPGVFFRLKALKAGSPIVVTLADGVIIRFGVTQVVEYSKSTFPDRLVYGSHGTRSLQLVTCGGVFDHATGHYESNIVVFSDLVGVTTPKSGVRG